MSAEFEQKNEAGVQQVLEQLAQKYPNPKYTKDLISISERALRGGSTKTSLDIYVVKFNAGVLTTPQEYTEMTELALQDGLPGLAKKVMEKGMSSGVLGQGASKDREARLMNMASTQADADQKALAKGEAEAQKQKTGEALVKYGEAYWSYGEFDKAIAATEAGIAKGVPDMNDAKLRLGIAYKMAGKSAQANDAFKSIAAGTVPAQIAGLWRVVK
jgi:tetratricopeptide (TPR) repeat protein